MNKILMGITVPAVTLLLPAALAAGAFACTGSSGPHAKASAVSVQVAPAVNLPISILSYGSANGTVRQAPSSSAVADAGASKHGSGHGKNGGTHCQPVHKSHKTHCAPKCEHGGPASGHGSGGATSTATSVQVAPVVSAPVAVLSNGSSNGPVTQASTSSVRSYATSGHSYHTSSSYRAGSSYRSTGGSPTGGYHSGGGTGGGHRVECSCPCSGGGLLHTITHTVTHTVTHLVSGLGL
jgi:hypothetical protein